MAAHCTPWYCYLGNCGLCRDLLAGKRNLKINIKILEALKFSHLQVYTKYTYICRDFVAINLWTLTLTFDLRNNSPSHDEYWYEVWWSTDRKIVKLWLWLKNFNWMAWMALEILRYEHSLGSTMTSEISENVFLCLPANNLCMVCSWSAANPRR